MSIEYINGTNSGKMYWFLRKLKEVTALGKKIGINFTFESDDDWMNDYGLALQEQLKIPVNMIAVEKLTSPVMVASPPYKSNNLSSE
ncbi:MAG: SiaC family regulatory phosphoprotein [Bacteroidales bacterium]